MKSNIVIVVVVQFMFACSTLNVQAAAPASGRDSDQLWNIDRELSQDCLRHRDGLRVKDNRQGRIRGQDRKLSTLRQSELLQELLPPHDRGPAADPLKNVQTSVHRISFRIDTRETAILEELLAAASTQ